MEHRKRTNRLRIVLWLAFLGVAVAVAFTVFRRPDMTDPAEIAKASGRSLRDAEVETLIRAAFRNAKEISIQSEGRPGRVKARSVTITDPMTLNRLADSFALGRDEYRPPEYPYPGVMYATVRFSGPYQPDFTFTSDAGIYIYSGRSVDIKSSFGKVVGDLLGLGNSSEHMQADEVKKTERLIENLAEPPSDAE
jgi:hypothetical protein